MTSSIDAELPGADAFNWIIGPAGRCASYAVEETKVASVLHRAIIVLSGLGPLLLGARKLLVDASRSPSHIDTLLSHQRALGPWAQELLRDDLHPINSHALIGMWSAVEVAIADTICLILMKDNEAVRIVAKAGVKVPPSAVVPLELAMARKITKRLEYASRQLYPRVGDTYCYMLRLFDIDLAISHDTMTALSEINYVRNCLLHRGGITDNRAAAEAPDLDVVPGQSIKVTPSLYQRYFKAVGEFAHAFLATVCKCKYARYKTGGPSAAS